MGIPLLLVVLVLGFCILSILSEVLSYQIVFLAKFLVAQQVRRKYQLYVQHYLRKGVISRCYKFFFQLLVRVILNAPLPDDDIYT